MRWEELFGDLESQADALARAELAGEVADRTRREVGRLRLVDRLRPAAGERVIARVHGCGALTGVLADVGADWIVVAEDGGRSALVPLSALLALTGVGARAEAPGSEGEVGSRLDLRYVLRALIRDRAPVEVGLVDGTVLTGTFDRVASDHVDLAQHDLGTPRRPSAVHQVLLLPLCAISVVRRGA